MQRTASPSTPRVAALAFAALFAAFVRTDAAPQPGELVWRADTKEPVISLTFDDGPGPYTEKVLALLAAHDAKATFFVLGENAATWPKWMKQIVDQGHEAASHTYSHVNFAKVPADEGTPKLASSIAKTSDLLEKIAGARPRYVRMPHGIDRPWIREVARQQGAVLVNWSFGCDWDPMPKDEMAQAYIKNVKPGAILLMHDGGKRQKTVDVLEALLKDLKAKGYRMVTVGELLERYPAPPVAARKVTAAKGR